MDAASWNTWPWAEWPWVVLARIASAAARVALDEVKGVRCGTRYDLHGAEQMLVALEDWLQSRALPFVDGPRPDFADDRVSRHVRQRPRWFEDAVFHAVTSTWAATREPA